MNENIRQNLIDAGCDDTFISIFEDSDTAKCQKMLAEHRRKLLDEIHAKEQSISCLDYLAFMMKKEGGF